VDLQGSMNFIDLRLGRVYTGKWLGPELRVVESVSSMDVSNSSQASRLSPLTFPAWLLAVRGRITTALPP